MKKILTTVTVTLLMFGMTPSIGAASIKDYCVVKNPTRNIRVIKSGRLTHSQYAKIQELIAKALKQVSRAPENKTPIEAPKTPEAPKAPVETPAVPEETKETPTETPEAPKNTPKAPVETPEAEETPEAPVETPKKPEQPKETQEESPKAPETSEQATGLNSFEQQVVELTNQERAKHGLAPLKINVELSKVARAKSQDMINNKYFAHQSPTYGSPFDMMKRFGINYRAAGENIAKGQRTPQQVVTAWMNSEGHRANILNSNYDQIGVGYATDANGTPYWTQMFIK